MKRAWLFNRFPRVRNLIEEEITAYAAEKQSRVPGVIKFDKKDFKAIRKRVVPRIKRAKFGIGVETILWAILSAFIRWAVERWLERRFGTP